MKILNKAFKYLNFTKNNFKNKEPYIGIYSLIILSVLIVIFFILWKSQDLRLHLKILATLISFLLFTQWIILSNIILVLLFDKNKKAFPELIFAAAVLIAGSLYLIQFAKTESAKIPGFFLIGNIFLFVIVNLIYHKVNDKNE
jgi:uncharacterized membrane protein YoaK (UPF0700 family)